MYVDIVLRNAEREARSVRDILINMQTDEMRIDQYSIHELLDEVLQRRIESIALKNIIVDKSYTTLDDKILVNKQKRTTALQMHYDQCDICSTVTCGVLKLITKSINGKCVIEIADNGRGMKLPYVRQISAAASDERLNSIQQVYLSAVELFKSNDASVAIKSKEGKGTSFSFSFERVI